MKICRVKGTVVSTFSHASYRSRKLMIVETLTPQRKKTGKETLAVDVVNAGIGDIVLVLKEGNSTRAILKEANPPLLDLIVAVVDEVYVQEER